MQRIMLLLLVVSTNLRNQKFPETYDKTAPSESLLWVRFVSVGFKPVTHSGQEKHLWENQLHPYFVLPRPGNIS